MDDDPDFIDIWPEENVRVSRFDPPICPSVHGAYHAMTRRLQVVTRDHGLDASEALVLVRIRRAPMSAPAVIRHALGLHRSTLASILGRLERDGLISRRRSPWGGRRLEIGLTPNGERLALIAEGLIQDLEQELRIFTSRADRRGAETVYAAFRAITRPDGPLDL
jgi:DNA-binding MarR family transcriptional regulator